MSVNKDKKTGKWMSQLRIRDRQGKTVHKKKRGFLTKREALEWERDYLACSRGSVSMRFEDLVRIYLNDMEHRLKNSTMENKRYIIDLKILPFFGKMLLGEIKPADIRQWQNSLTACRGKRGKGYSQTYLKAINNQMTAILNYAVKYYDLRENPCHRAGSIGKKQAGEMLFWTRDEFDRFIEAVKDKPLYYAVFMTLYYTGAREGEILALTPADLNFDRKTVTVNKSYQRLGGKDVITSPKTPKSNRVISLPRFLCDCLKDYISRCGLQSSDRLFPCTKYCLLREMDRGCRKSGVKRIRIHDIRHSHASLLAEMGFSPLLIAERLGHESVRTTMEIYSHLYPNKQLEVAEKLDSWTYSKRY